MARPKKIGLDYFPLNCQMNDKVVLLEKAHGLVGFAVYVKLLQKIYKTESGELDLSDNKQSRLIALSFGLALESFLEVVFTMCELDLFDETAYQDCKILTSKGVKKRMVQVDSLRRRKRDKTELIEDKPGTTELLPDITPLPPSESTQKEKEREKESYLENNTSTTSSVSRGSEGSNENLERPFSDSAPPVAPPPPDEKPYPNYVAPSAREVVDYFEENGSDRAEAMVFYREYSGRDWYNKANQKMSNWQKTALAWIKNEKANQRQREEPKVNLSFKVDRTAQPSNLQKRLTNAQTYINQDRYDEEGNRKIA